MEVEGRDVKSLYRRSKVEKRCSVSANEVKGSGGGGGGECVKIILLQIPSTLNYVPHYHLPVHCLHRIPFTSPVPAIVATLKTQ